MQYILECMFLLVLATTSSGVGTLKTTGKPATLKDLGVAMLGWIVLGIIIIIIIYAINSVKREKDAVVSDDLIIKQSNGLLYFIECMMLALISIFGGKNRTMITTGKKPTKKEVLTSGISWSVIIVAVIVAVIFICI